MVFAMRILFLTLATAVISAGVLLNAYSKKQQFYPTIVYLIRSSRTMSILYLQAFLIGWQIMKLMKFVFLGALRAIEIEHLIERSWFAVIDTFILLAAFHQDMSPMFVGMVTLLFAAKSFHWLVRDRVDHMEQSPVIGLKFHIRATTLLLILCGIDLWFVSRAWSSLKVRGLSVDIVFGLEYAIMLTEALNTFLKYILHSIDLRSDNPWESKPIYIRYVDIVLGVIELLLYASYMTFMLMIPFIPLHIARRVYRAARDFQRSVYEVITSYQAIRNLNTLYPDATTEELQTVDNVCIICREEMVERCKKLPCNHIFHTNCLRSWFQRQHTCPTCRLDVIRVNANRTRQTNRQQQQQQQQQQQRDNEQVPPPQAPPPIMFPPMMGWPLAAPPQQRHQPNQQDGRQETPPVGNNGVPPGNASATESNIVPPVSQVPFTPQFPPHPFMMPFPPMFGAQSDEAMQNMLNGLTDEQLLQLEGMERSNVEARIALLRNIQQLLDAAVTQLNQYSLVTSSLNIPVGPGFPGFPYPPNTQHPMSRPPNEPNEDTSVQIDIPPNEDSSDTTSAQRSQSLGDRLIESPVTTLGFDVKTFSKPKNDNDNDEMGEGEGEGEMIRKDHSVDIPDSELIRRRRLLRFHSAPVTTTLGSLHERESDEDDMED